MGKTAVELFEDCPHCRLEGGLVETYDAHEAACRFGVPAFVACKLCGLAKRGEVSPLRDGAPHVSRVAANACPSCLELLAPEALDVRRCASCGAHASLADRTAPFDLTSFDDFADRLREWATRDGFRDISELVEATFVEPDVRALHALFLRGELLETVVDPFALGGRAGGGASASREPRGDTPSERKRSPASVRVVGPADKPSVVPGSSSRSAVQESLGPSLAAPALPREARESRSAYGAESPRSSGSPSSAPFSAPPRAILYPLVSVISADGEIHPAERAFVDAFLQGEGLAPLADHEVRVYTPAEVAPYVPNERREKIVELMCEVAMVDGLADDAEVRVVRAYASAWRISEEKVSTWLWGYEHAQASPARQFWLKIRRFVLSSRWEKEDS